MRVRLPFMFALAMLVGVATAIAASSDEAFLAYQKGDYKNAIKLLTPLAQAGDDKAQYNLGVMYANALGVSQNFKEAAKWFEMAVAKGNAFAMVDLATQYLAGEGVQKDYKEAMRLYQLAASKNNP